jgi:hypothetical protein
MPEPEPSPLARVFDHVYLTAGESFWRLSDRARSKETLRRAFALSRSYRAPVQVDIAAYPLVCWPQYATLEVFGAASAADIEVFLSDFHARHEAHPYPAGLLDPAGRMQRWP